MADESEHDAMMRRCAEACTLADAALAGSGRDFHDPIRMGIRSARKILSALPGALGAPAPMVVSGEWRDGFSEACRSTRARLAAAAKGNTMKTADELEREAVEAKRRAENARHTPLTEAEWADLEALEQRSVHGALDVAKAHGDVWNAYTSDLNCLLQMVHRLRKEAWYWKDRAAQAAAAKGESDAR